MTIERQKSVKNHLSLIVDQEIIELGFRLEEFEINVFPISGLISFLLSKETPEPFWGEQLEAVSKPFSSGIIALHTTFCLLGG